ncbi:MULTISPECIES: peptide antibiotic transporter SbmA [unclassified Mesorhizobium]|uniref:peptide antibiotic transporter SbmA n=1 Tax=unclassified Mesorhizobium TaxID=325217 RepID=UPI0011278183|nr:MULTISPECIES: peptide antibiotic transporter SbmA [unclassified Mesorhizobium]MCA0029844.1 peptide antibiotic transporter SbmA [Mesorhizobium sp. B263B2A]TPN47227.1 peptide antibiotic transporter SbmA [Mesorhizobium sp. B1-1-7]TPN53372.1 peptide antibiotic transporter SbmA [Mesorhizobium sp. B1-1-9]
MFVSFFPQPKLFFTSAAVWSLAAILFWFFGGEQLGAVIGLPPAAADAPPIIGIAVLVSKPFLWFYIYFTFCVAIFYAFWSWYSPHPWQRWSILMTAVILFFIYFNVQVSVAVNAWYGPFFDYVQGLMSGTGKSTNGEFYTGLADFSWLALVGMNVQVVNAFIVSHWIFRWRTAMNNYFIENWARLRHIEGASQRIQEDTMRFSQIMEDLGSSFVQSIMTLIAFLPVMIQLQAHISELPIIGAIPQPLVVAALAWCLFGTISVMIAGMKLPGLQFRNQRVEAAYRKELVYGEDHADRAQPATTSELFANVRHNYFRLYFHYIYFNVVRYTYLQADNIFSLLILGPSLVAHKITFGALNQISNAFGKVTGSLQFLLTSWSTIVELQSVHKRLRAFEATLLGEPLPDIDQRYLARQGAEDPA